MTSSSEDRCNQAMTACQVVKRLGAWDFCQTLSCLRYQDRCHKLATTHEDCYRSGVLAFNNGISGPLTGFQRNIHCIHHSPAQDDPNATCAFWDENVAKWSSEGVDTLPSESPGTLVCSTRHLSIFGGVVSVGLILGRR